MIQIGVTPATIDSPVEHLMACHRRIEQRLDTLTLAADRLRENPAEAALAIEHSLRFLDTNGAMHTADEEDSLFPRLRPVLSPSETAFVDSLEADHQIAEAAYEELKKCAQAVLHDPVPDRIQRYRECAGRLREIYRKHIHAEDEILTALAKRLLGRSEFEQISGEMKARRGLSS